MTSPWLIGMRAKAALFAALLVPIAACGGDHDPASRIISLRVIAMNAKRVSKPVTLPDGTIVGAACVAPDCVDPAGGSYAHPGDEVELELLWHDPSDPNKERNERSWMWTTCLNPPSSSVLGCFQKLGQDVGQGRLPFLEERKAGTPEQTAKLRAFEAKSTFRLKIPDDAISSLPPQGRRGAMMGVVFLSCPGRLKLNFEALAARRNELPVLCLGPDDEVLGADKFTIGLKRVFIRAKDENRDPQIAQLTYPGTVDGKPTAIVWGPTDRPTIGSGCNTDEQRFDRCEGAAPLALNIQFDGNPIQVGTDEFGTPFEEQVVVQYYATEGIFEYDVKRAQEPSTKLVGRNAPGEHKLWVVARDNRGGVTWIERTFIIK